MNFQKISKYKSLLLISLLLIVSIDSWAGIIIGGTRVIYDSNKKETSISILNPKESGVFLVQSWIDSDEINKKAPFIVTPPLFRINSGNEHILRIVYIGDNLPKDRESVFWLNIKSIPAVDDTKLRNNQLQLVVKSRIKLFYRPDGLDGEPEGIWTQLRVSRSNNSLHISNPTPYYITLLNLKVDGKEIKEVDMIAPKSNVTFTIPSEAIHHVTWQAINDFGAISEIESRNL